MSRTQNFESNTNTSKVMLIQTHKQSEKNIYFGLDIVGSPRKRVTGDGFPFSHVGSKSAHCASTSPCFCNIFKYCSGPINHGMMVYIL